MFGRDYWDEVFASLAKNKGRAILTMMGVVLGIMILIVLLGLSKGFQNKLLSNFGDMSTNSAYFWPRRTSLPYQGFPAHRWYGFRNSDIDLLKAKVPEIKYLAPDVPSLRTDEDNIVYNDLSFTFKVSGYSGDGFAANPVEIIHGRLFNEKDIDQRRKIAVLSLEIATQIFGEGIDPVGEELTIFGYIFHVVGVFEPMTERDVGDDRSSEIIYIPYTLMQQMTRRGDRINSYFITVEDGINMKDIIPKIQSVIKKRYHINPDDEVAVGAWDFSESFEMFNSLFYTIISLMWLVGGGTLLGGIIGITNIMLVTVKERTTELGVKRALGATPFRIILEILTESISITLLAGSIGFLFGYFITLGIDKVMTTMGSEAPLLNPLVDFSTALGSLLILVFFGCLAGLLPAFKAVTIRPIEAIRGD